VGGHVEVGVAPPLSERGELVWRRSGHDRRPTIGVEAKQRRVGPRVRAGRPDEHRQVPPDLDAERRGGLAQPRPLDVERPLQREVPRDRRPQTIVGRGEGRRVPVAERRRPDRPLGAKILRDRLVARPVERPRRSPREHVDRSGDPVRRGPKRRSFAGLHVRPVHPVRGERRERALVGGEPAVGDEVIDGQQQGLGRERRRRRVGAAVLVRHEQGQDLPDAQPGGVEPVQQAARVRSDVSDAVRPRQRRRVQEQAGAARAHRIDHTAFGPRIERAARSVAARRSSRYRTSIGSAPSDAAISAAVPGW
jgi:hypothetical protein